MIDGGTILNVEIEPREKRRIAREELKKLQTMEEEREELKKQYYHIISKTSPKGLPASSLECEHVSGGGAEPTLTLLQKITEYQGLIQMEDEKIVEEQIRLFRIIAMIPNSRYRMLLRSKYIQGHSLERIACEWHMAYESIKYNHKKALESFYDILQSLPVFTPHACDIM